MVSLNLNYYSPYSIDRESRFYKGRIQLYFPERQQTQKLNFSCPALLSTSSFLKVFNRLSSAIKFGLEAFHPF